MISAEEIRNTYKDHYESAIHIQLNTIEKLVKEKASEGFTQASFSVYMDHLDDLLNRLHKLGYDLLERKGSFITIGWSKTTNER